MSELENRLAGLHALPVAPLPGAEAARRRGEQRTRRTRAGLAGAGALVAVLALSAGAAIGGGGPERMAPPPARPGPSADAEVGLSVSLLDAADVAAARAGGAWEVRPTDDFPFDPLPAGCADQAEVFGGPVETALRFLDGPETADGPLTVGHSLKAYAAEDQAQAAFQRVVQAIRTCGETSDGPQVIAGEPASTDTRTYGTLRAGTRTVVFAVERVGAVLSGVAIRSFELNDSPPLADAAATEVAGGPYAVATEAPVAGPDAPGPLRPEDVATVEPGTWTVLRLPSDADLLRPCGQPAGGPVPVSVDGTDLRRRVVGGGVTEHGSFVYQQVFRYASAADAAQALADRRTAVEACPEEPITTEPNPDPGMRGTRTYEAIDTGQIPFLVRIKTQCQSCPASYSYAAAEQVEDRLTVLGVALAQDGDPGAGLILEYARVAAERLRAAG